MILACKVRPLTSLDVLKLPSDSNILGFYYYYRHGRE